ncbi:YtjB family periplasmic protein [Avibacterium gallinarum]|uniref:YtjB family periplasmic protein n=1 Tax=Avibacterium gallinarum TaxID=755 RepID=UPI003BF895F6
MQLIKEKALKITMIFIIILFCLGIMGVILFGVQQFKLGSQLASVNQVTNLSHLLVRQQANLFSMLLINNAKSEQLTENLDNFVKEDFILDASVYSNRGELLAQSSNASLLRLQLGLDQPVAKEIINQQIVEPIYSSDGVEGFLRVTFNNKYGQTTQSKINLIFNRLYGEIIIVFLTGILFASSIHYFLSRYRRVKRKQLELSQPAKKKQPQTASRLTYHSRRRRFKNKS